MISILMVDDHQLYLDGMNQLLNRLGDEVVTTCVDNAEQALVNISESSYDLILLDLGLPGLSGHDFIHALVGRNVFTPVAVVSGSDQAEDIARVMDAGAFAYIHKSTSADEILKILDSVLAGNIYWPDDYPISNKPSFGSHNEKSTANKSLTPRQLEVLRLLAQGHTNKRIAIILNVSDETIKTHLRALFDSLKANNRTECVTLARQHNLLLE